jgi:RHS repeat-associated protein
VADTGESAFSHRYVLRHTYDLDGRRTSLRHPPQLAAGATADSAYFRYDPVTGALERTVDIMGNVTRYQYNVRGELAKGFLADQTVDTYGYDHDGNPLTHQTDQESGSVRNITIGMDARGKRTSYTNTVGAREELAFTYSGLGHVLTNASLARGNSLGVPYKVTADQRFTYDPFGNMRYQSTVSRTTRLDDDVDIRQHALKRLQAYEPSTGRHIASTDSAYQHDMLLYDGAGNTTFTTQSALDAFGHSSAQDRVSYYGADNKLVAVDFRTVSPGLPPDEWNTTFEEYRYDALGRRVWLRSRRFCASATTWECNVSYVRRTVWDGDAELYEIQMPGASDTPADTLENDTQPVERGRELNNFDPNRFFGRVAYAYGLGIDQPVTIVRFNYADATDDLYNPKTWTPYPIFTIVPQWNLRGSAENGRLLLAGSTQGLAGYCLNEPTSRCVWASFNGFFEVYGPLVSVTTISFQGTLLNDKQDNAQTLYRRNRTYDPKTGRFTQEDPIGLAGGLNLYGYANGDPVSYSDPFGMWPDWIDNLRVRWQRANEEARARSEAWENGGRDAWIASGDFKKAMDRNWETSKVAVFGTVGGGGGRLFNATEAKALQGLFGSGVKGAAARLANMEVPAGISREMLETYAEKVARPIVEGIGRKSTAAAQAVQSMRLQIIEEALKLLK